MRILWHPGAGGGGVVSPTQPTVEAKPVSNGLKDLSKITILLVDDSSNWRRENSKWLIKAFNCTVITANNPDEALTLLKTINPDIIVSELNMGEKSGLDLARERPQNIPFILISNCFPTDLKTDGLNISAKIDKGHGVELANAIRSVFAEDK